MRYSSLSILFLCAGVSLIPINTASAQMLTGFGDDSAKTEERPAKIIEANNYIAPVEIAKQPARPNTLLTGFGDDMLAGKSSAKPISSDVSNPPVFPATTSNPEPPEETEPDLSNPVDLQADNLMNDEATQTVTASGNVMLVQDGRILRADKVSYNIAQDRVIATGNVVLNEENGDIHTADQVELTDSMKSGVVDKLKTYLADGSRFTATEGERKNAEKVIMKQANYTPCEPCKNDPEKPVVWQIKASEVTHHADEQRISYENARFELYGVPIAYTPYFSHPDGSVDRKSGFLSPIFGVDSELGVNAGTSYYWAIAPDRDATFGIRAFTEQLPLLSGEWRQRWDNASLLAQGGITYSKRTDKADGVNFRKEDEVRGHIFAKGLWDMNDKWRSGLNVEYASDEQYLRQYDFNSNDVLKNEVYAERFSGRHYSVVRAMAFQDVRVGQFQEDDQPNVFPEIISSWVGEPGSMPLIGGRWELQGSMLGLYREGNDQDIGRMSLEAGWNRRLVSDMGLVTTLDGDLRGDFYKVLDRDTTFSNGNDIETRFFPQFQVQSSYPVAKHFEKFQMVVEPTAAITVSSQIDNNNDIPNEDSQDVQIDTANLFEPNRFPGFDRVEDGSRATYGLRTGFYGHEGSTIELFAGQSRRFSNDDNPFPAGSGLDSRKSDYVGEIFANYKERYSLNYRVQLTEENLESERHEFDGRADFGDLDVSMRYLYANALDGTAITESREQVGADIGYYWNDKWRTSAGGVQDLGENSGLRYAYAGLEHFGQCLNWSVTAVRNLTDDASGESSTELMLRIGLKNLGEFNTSGIELARTEAQTPAVNSP